MYGNCNSGYKRLNPENPSPEQIKGCVLALSKYIHSPCLDNISKRLTHKLLHEIKLVSDQIKKLSPKDKTSLEYLHSRLRMLKAEIAKINTRINNVKTILPGSSLLTHIAMNVLVNFMLQSSNPMNTVITHMEWGHIVLIAQPE